MINDVIMHGTVRHLWKKTHKKDVVGIVTFDLTGLLPINHIITGDCEETFDVNSKIAQATQNIWNFIVRKSNLQDMTNFGKVMYQSYWSFNILLPPPPPGIPRAFDTFAVPGRREFDYQSLPGCGEFDPHVLGWGIWTAPSISCEISGVTSYHGGHGVRGFSRKRLCLCGQLVTRKGLKEALCRIWRYLNFNIFNIGFRLWVCVYNDIQHRRIPISAIQYYNKKLNRGQYYFDLSHVCFKINN